MELVAMEELSVVRDTPDGPCPVLTDLAFHLGPGQTFGLVGDSGAGKTVFARTLAGLLSPPFRIAAGRLRIAGRVMREDPAAWREMRGRRVFMIFQSSSLALNPNMRAGEQVVETLTEVKGWKRRAAREWAVHLFQRVGLEPDDVKRHPRRMSGGMRQRVQIAVALALEPAVLIADEPTTGLDAVTQKQVLELLSSVVSERNMGLIFISHDLRLVARLATSVGILDSGRFTDQGSFAEVFRRGRSHQADRMLDHLEIMDGNP